MDLSAAPPPFVAKQDLQAAKTMQIWDLPVLLAALAVRQATGLTARRVRGGDPPRLAGDEPARMAMIFAPGADQPAALAKGATGSFNARVAAKLAMGDDGEVDVYSGT